MKIFKLKILNDKDRNKFESRNSKY